MNKYLFPGVTIKCKVGKDKIKVNPVLAVFSGLSVATLAACGFHFQHGWNLHLQMRFPCQHGWNRDRATVKRDWFPSKEGLEKDAVENHSTASFLLLKSEWRDNEGVLEKDEERLWIKKSLS